MELEKINTDLKSLVNQFNEDLKGFEKTEVKCAIIGRSGTGKSSLINAIAGEEIAKVGEIETTMTVNEPLKHKGLLIYDLPGCGTTNFPKESYLEKFDIEQFDCIILATSDRFLEDDLFLINELSKIGKAVFTTRTKIDYSVDRAKRRGVSEEVTLADVRNNMEESLAECQVKGIYLTSADFPQEYDLSKLLEDIYASLPEIKRDRFLADVNITSTKILAEKRAIAEKSVSMYSTLAAANALNPIPGLDVGVDIAFMVKMSNQIREVYGLTTEQQAFNSQFVDKKYFKVIGAEIAQYAAKYGVKEGLMILLKNSGTRLASKTILKYIPLVGQAIAGVIGFKMTSSIGKDMIDDAEKIAGNILGVFNDVDASNFSNPAISYTEDTEATIVD